MRSPNSPQKDNYGRKKMIELTPTEVALAAQIGSRRYIESTFSKRQQKIGASDGWNNNIEGCLAEVALAKHLNAWFDPHLMKFGEADVLDWHVRSTHHSNGHLYIADYEETGKYILMIGKFNEWRIAGWCHAEDVRKPEFFRTVRDDRTVPNYWIPQKELQKLEL